MFRSSVTAASEYLQRQANGSQAVEPELGTHQYGTDEREGARELKRTPRVPKRATAWDGAVRGRAELRT